MEMLKQIILLLLLSLLVINFMSYTQHGLEFLVTAHDWIADVLTQVFSGGKAGELSRQLITLLAVPVFIGLIPAIIYAIVRRNWFPYFMRLVWIVWLIQATALIVVFQA